MPFSFEFDDSPEEPGDPKAVLQELQALRAQSWEGRIQEGAYTSPSGVRLVFDFEDVSRKVSLRGTVFGFPGVNEQYVQRKGYGSRTYPLRCFFSGPNHDLLALQFEAALLEEGTGQLEHPMYGTIENVVPFGDIDRSDALVTAANQSVVQVTFWTTTTTAYPSAERDAVSEIQQALEAFDVVGANAFAENTELDTEGKRADTKAGIKGLLSSVSDALTSISDTVAEIRHTFAEGVAAINQGIDVFIGQPLVLARQIIDLTKAPGRALDGIQSRLDAYGSLAENIFASGPGNPDRAITATASAPLIASRQDRIVNDWQTANLFAGAAIAGALTASLAHRYTSKPEALLAAATLQAQWEAFVAWRDAGFEALEALATSGGQVDTGESYHALQSAASLAIGRLVELSFSLLPERKIRVDRDRGIIELCSELYKRIDNDTLDFFVATNHLTGDEILEIPKNRVIVFYA